MRQSVIAAGLTLLLTACATAPGPKPLRAAPTPPLERDLRLSLRRRSRVITRARSSPRGIAYSAV